MSFPTITAKALFSSAMVVAIPGALNFSSNTCMATATQTNRAEAISEQLKVSSIASGMTVKAIEVVRWSAEKNLRFKELARNEALQELSIEELAELESLTRLRRFEKYPRSAEEILWQRRQQDITRALMQKLKEYVDFHETPHNS